jgi:uncharacterized Fe-S cluster-containing radical SAM superfamily enzyme
VHCSAEEVICQHTNRKETASPAKLGKAPEGKLPLPANGGDKVSTVLVNQGDKEGEILLDKSTLFSMETTRRKCRLMTET